MAAMPTFGGCNPNQTMAEAQLPYHLENSVLRLVADRRVSGILHVSGEKDISYAEAASIGARMLGADENLFKPIRACDSGFYTEPVPAHTTLNIDRLRSLLGVEPPDIQWTPRAAFVAALQEQRQAGLGTSVEE